MSLNISLPIELETRVREHVASGLYGSASEVIREALRLFEAYQSVQTSSLLALKADVAKGIADAQAGRIDKMDWHPSRRRAERRGRRDQKSNGDRPVCAKR